MADITTAARPYAKAVFELALEHSRFDKWSEMLTLMAAVAHDPTMHALLESPRLSREQASELFISICQERIDEQGQNVIKLMAENRRLTLLPEVAAIYEHMRADAEGKIEAVVTSAETLTEDETNAIVLSLKKRLGREVSLSARTDPSLLGGAVIRAGDLVIDGSIRGKLEKLATALSR
jgi:F-type H+-transporting ATPase subunit delta